jgi:GTPase SAR1 family protein
MLKKKICLLGSYGVGKTSLVARFVHGTVPESPRERPRLPD